MKVLVVGGGGREHALVWKLNEDSSKPTLFCAPGNAGTAALATNLPIGSGEIDSIVEWAAANRPDLTAIGPEAPLCAGLTDRLEARGLRVFGPCRDAARLEGSKAFAKDVMRCAGVSTAKAAVFRDHRKARSHVREWGAPLVVKADGLAAGKGVFVCMSLDEAYEAVDRLLLRREMGEAGAEIVIEEFLEGEEASIMALTDGERFVILPSSQDHKRAYDGDQGPNTGGMGAYSPAPVVTDAVLSAVRSAVLEPTVAELRKRGVTYRGVLYAGIMVKDGVPKVLEFNCRFGDPETQAVVPRIKGDLLPALLACCTGTLSEDLLCRRAEETVCVVVASGGYPGTFQKGFPIEGLDAAAQRKDVLVLHAGTRIERGCAVTDGGRVLGIVGLGASLKEAAARAYGAVGDIRFEGAFWRRDIARRALAGTRSSSGEAL